MAPASSSEAVGPDESSWNEGSSEEQEASSSEAAGPDERSHHEGSTARTEVIARAVQRALSRARSGKSLSVDEAEALLQARGEDLGELMALAVRLRSLGRGTTITYSRKVFVPLTM